MKFGLMLVLILLSQLSIAQTMKEKKTKQEMLERVDTLLLHVDEGKKALEAEDVVLACEKINELFRLLPDHLMSIGTRMNMLSGKIIKMENESKKFLIDMHMNSNRCAIGETGENLDIRETRKQLKKMKKSLKKQKKRISKSDTNFNNRYNYYYEFQ